MTTSSSLQEQQPTQKKAQAITHWISENLPVLPDSVFVNDDIVPHLPYHSYVHLQRDEIPLMVMNSPIAMWGIQSQPSTLTGLVVTNLGIHYKLKEDTLLAHVKFGPFATPIQGFLPYTLIKFMDIGKRIQFCVIAYQGNRLNINGYTIGLLRMGARLKADEKLEAFLSTFFQTCINA